MGLQPTIDRPCEWTVRLERSLFIRKSLYSHSTWQAKEDPITSIDT